MKRTCFVCIFLFSTTTLLLSQSNSVPQIHRMTPSVVSPVGESQIPRGRIRSPARPPVPQQTLDSLFAPAVPYASDGNAFSLALADVNGDGKLDLIVANENSTVGVLLGNGDGTFQSVRTFRVNGNDSISVAVADVNRDGKPDLLVTNLCGGGGNCDGSVDVLLGNGDGTFQTPVSYLTGGYGAEGVSVTDLRGDGYPDIVVANYCDNNPNCPNEGEGGVGVLLNNGDGTFRTAVLYESGCSSAYSVSVTDVNGDGILDLLVTNEYCPTGLDGHGNVGVLLGNGDGTFQQAVSYLSGGHSIAVSDVNGDGKPDIIVADFGAVGVLIGNGNGTFQPEVSYISTGGDYSWAVTVGDVNGDGIPDLLVSNQCVSATDCDNGTVGVLLGNGDGTFQAAVPYDSGGYIAYPVAVADLNGDGKLDLLIGNQCANSGDCPNGTVGVLINISLPPTKTSLLSSVNPSNFGQTVIFTATVIPHGSGTPTGTVTFTYGSTTLCNAVILSGVTATCTYSTLPAGTDVVTAAYSGDDNFASSSGSVNQMVNKPTTTATVTSSINPSNFDQQSTFMATVTGEFGGAPTGTVTFIYGSTTLCNAVTLSGGTATCAYSVLPVGSDTITAIYSGDSNFSGSSASLNQTVNQASTTVALVSSLNPSGLDSPVTFTVTIAPQYGGQATGTIIFKDGTTTLGSSGVVGNVASLTTSALAIGTHSVTSTYSGDSNFTGSASNIVSQVVTKATTTTALVSSANPSVQGKSVTFTASVSSLAGTPTGKVQFLDGKTVLATVKLTSGSAKYTTSKLSPGANSITAIYEGDSNNGGSTSSPVDQFVIATTTTALSSSPNPSAYGQAVTFTAVVAPAPPDGETVSFIKGKTVLGTGTLGSGSASFTTSTLKVGTTSVTAVYGGDSTFAGSKSDVVKQVVEKAGK